MKIGILTFHRALNYGAVLQAYASKEVLTKMGHNVEIIDYRQKYIESIYYSNDIKRFFYKNIFKIFYKVFSEILLYKRKNNRKEVFYNFIKDNLKLSSKPCFSASEIPDNYDAYIFGSDQIWNYKLTKGKDEVYWGYIKTKINAKKIVYAASMETKAINDKDKSFYSVSLKNFNSISIREKELTAMLQILTDKHITTVLDPTLLTDLAIWEKLAIRPGLKHKYVLVYQVRINKKIIEIAENIANQINGKVILLSSCINKEDNFKHYPTPQEFIGLIKYASCIVTTSFHGTAFSILFNRPFYSLFLNDGSDNRIKSFLEELHLTDRFISVNTTPLFSEIDFKISNKILEKKRKESIEYLNNALENID